MNNWFIYVFSMYILNVIVITFVINEFLVWFLHV